MNSNEIHSKSVLNELEKIKDLFELKKKIYQAEIKILKEQILVLIEDFMAGSLKKSTGKTGSFFF